MPDLSALLADVIAAPEDDAPRPAYAAAVAMTDPERAELISVQLRLDASRKAEQPAAERGTAAARAAALVRARGAEWAAEVAPLVAKWIFLRGFVEDVALDAAAFLAHADELYRRAPILHVELTGARAVWGDLVASPHLQRLHSLDFRRDDLGDDELGQLAQHALPKLRWLGLANNRITRAGLNALAAATQVHFPRLAYVQWLGNAVDDPLPGVIDEYTTETALSRELHAQYGQLPWLEYAKYTSWPPERDALP